MSGAVPNATLSELKTSSIVTELRDAAVAQVHRESAPIALLAPQKITLNFLSLVGDNNH